MCIKLDEEGDINYCTYRTQTIYGEARCEICTALFRQWMMIFVTKRDLKKVDLFKVDKYIV
jgi:hypothetical protein